MIKNGRSSTTPAVITETMLGWSESFAMALASAVNSPFSRSVRGTSGRTTFTATLCWGQDCS